VRLEYWMSFCPDMDHRQGWRQRAGGHNMFRNDLMAMVVEIDEIAGGHVHRAAGIARGLAVQAVEIDQIM